ncbi:divergent polysaccharide deacetylase family protein [Parvularcula dongshanensis]|uniref:Divergent polysaccharide deacetylase family protein n=1 Tax=Parvularcula dongshanensis TaxID=1173995 RepID=A0A840I251_9PROT|nr:divergent polysaccharide deacetylase family protein [Parvularcula dongshanensis]MBB4658314.1 hypothetical protein [Parvularcula dongshanensis]
MRRTPPPSRLRIAWALLILGVLGLVLAAVLVPPPAAPDRSVDLALPTRPDPYAPTGSAMIAEPMPEDDELPIVVRGAEPEEAASDGPGEVVISVLDTPGRTPRAPHEGNPATPPAAPDPGLTRSTPDGPVPARGADGRTPFEAYRRTQKAGEGASLGVVLSGLGLDPALTERALALPPEVSLAFAPYARGLPSLIERARSAGHEVLIELPMSTPGVAPAALGPAALSAERDARGNDRRLAWLLARAPAYPMVTNYLGAGFSRDEAAMGRLMARVAEAGLGYVDDTGAAAGAARIAGVPYAATDRLITPEDGNPAAALRAAAAAARPGRVSLVKVYASDDAVTAIERFLAEPRVGVVPASSAVRTQ